MDTLMYTTQWISNNFPPLPVSIQTKYEDISIYLTEGTFSNDNYNNNDNTNYDDNYDSEIDYDSDNYDSDKQSNDEFEDEYNDI